MAHPYGTTYEFRNIRANTGYTYNGVTSGSLSGTITRATATRLNITKNYKIIVPGTAASITRADTNDGDRGAGNVYSTTQSFGRTGCTGNLCFAAHALNLGDVTNYSKCTLKINCLKVYEDDWRNYGVQYYVGSMRLHNQYSEAETYGPKIMSIGNHTITIDISSLTGTQYLNVSSAFYDYDVYSVILEP